MWHWYVPAYTLKDWIKSGKEKCKLSSAMMVEQLRLWRTCISYGFCIAHSTDFSPILCLWLSPPVFENLCKSNVLSEFSSIARESYLALGGLAQRLTLLRSVEQLGKQIVGVLESLGREEQYKGFLFLPNFTSAKLSCDEGSCSRLKVIFGSVIAWNTLTTELRSFNVCSTS